MFVVERVTTFEYYCPNGHTPPQPMPQSQRLRFCHSCGLPLEERQESYDASYCANCRNPVDPSWNHCPYCGQERETK